MTPSQHPQECVDKKMILEVFEELQKDTYSDIDPIDVRISTYIDWIREGNYDYTPSDVLVNIDEMITHFKGFEDQDSFKYNASDIVGYLGNFEKREQLRQHRGKVRNESDLLDRLDKEIAIRENEMNRKGGLTDNIVTASGFYASAGALNWVRTVLINALRQQHKDGEQL